MDMEYKMDNMNKIIVNCETNETEIIPLTKDEIAELKKQSEQEQKKDLAAEAEIEAKAAQKKALLEKLGITADEAKLLLG